MKEKWRRILPIGIFLGFLCACDKNVSSVTTVLVEPQPVVEENIDVDLTKLSSTLLYSEVYRIVTTPMDYIGKTIKMNGSFSAYQDPATNQLYFACIIRDATACCAQGIEFELSGDYIYPDDYPQVNDDITVSGEFETYEEEGIMYCRLKDASLISESEKISQR